MKFDHSFFQNTACDYFPCHQNMEKDHFNCLFCYCPLYTLGNGCGGNCTYSEKGIKSCQDCTFPHKKENYQKILLRFQELAHLAKESTE